MLSGFSLQQLLVALLCTLHVSGIVSPPRFVQRNFICTLIPAVGLTILMVLFLWDWHSVIPNITYGIHWRCYEAILYFVISDNIQWG